MNIAWGDKQGDLNTTATDGSSFRTARITVVGNTGAYFSGYTAGNVNLNNAQTFTNVYLPILGDTDGDGFVDLNDLECGGN